MCKYFCHNLFWNNDCDTFFVILSPTLCKVKVLTAKISYFL